MNHISWESKVGCPKGVHCRVAAQLTEIVAGHDVDVRIVNRDETIDCTSMLEILSLSFAHGSRMSFTAHGPDAHKVAAAIDRLISSEDEF